MGRELKRKQAKREGRNVKEMQVKSRNNSLKPKTLIVILINIVFICIIIYLITGLFITKDLKHSSSNSSSTDNSTNNTSSVSNKILAIDSLKQSEDDYYVYYFDSDNDMISNIGLLSGKIYRVDLKDDFNSNFVGTSSGIVSDINDLRVSNPTVIRVSNGKITEFYSGSEEINNILK